MKVSDHIILRYYERVMGLDSKLVKKTLLNCIGKEDGAHVIPNSNFYVIVRDKTAVTIIDKREYLQKAKVKSKKNRAEPKQKRELSGNLCRFAYDHILEMAEKDCLT